MSEVVLSDFERRAEQRAHHRALIMQILNGHPEGLTTQEIVAKEQELFGYTFLTDNRLRECRKKSWVISEIGTDKLVRWKKIE